MQTTLTRETTLPTPGSCWKRPEWPRISATSVGALHRLDTPRDVDIVQFDVALALIAAALEAAPPGGQGLQRGSTAGTQRLSENPTTSNSHPSTSTESTVSIRSRACSATGASGWRTCLRDARHRPGPQSDLGSAEGPAARIPTPRRVAAFDTLFGAPDTTVDGMSEWFEIVGPEQPRRDPFTAMATLYELRELAGAVKPSLPAICWLGRVRRSRP